MCTSVLLWHLKSDRDENRLASGGLTAQGVVRVAALSSPLSVLSALCSEAVGAAVRFPGPRRQVV